MSDMTTIKVPKVVRDRLQKVAGIKGATLAQTIDELLDEASARPKPTVGGYRSKQPLTAKQIDQQLRDGFGA